MTLGDMVQVLHAKVLVGEEKLETPESLYEDELWALIREQEELLYETA